VGDDCAIAVWRFAAMISEMLKVRDGRIPRILARTSTLSVTRNVARGEAGLSNCEANGRAFQGCVGFKKLEDLALDVVSRTVSAHDPIFVRVDLRPVMPEPKC
jgi:hypothetical protein